eukprot:6791044-Pyramimonas_sp.AAC.1
MRAMRSQADPTAGVNQKPFSSQTGRARRGGGGKEGMMRRISGLQDSRTPGWVDSRTPGGSRG